MAQKGMPRRSGKLVLQGMAPPELVKNEVGFAHIEEFMDELGATRWPKRVRQGAQGGLCLKGWLRLNL